ncbi:MAG: ADP-ribosylation factor-like protein [Candidatus Helarchaeota archaeon]
MGIKVLVMGLRAAGKTTLIKQVLEGKEFYELENIAATEGIETPAYKYRGLVEINVFDCGGQTQFLENYYSESMIGTIFGGKTRILFWVVDSSDRSLLKNSRSEFLRAFKAVREYSSIYPLIYILVHKYDIKQILKKEIENYFKELEEVKGIHFYTTSCVLGTARKVMIKLLDEIVKKESELRIKSLQKILKSLNSKINASLSTLINSEDGLEIASEFDVSLKIEKNIKTLEFLQYLSVKVMSDSLDRAQKIFDNFKLHNFITNSKYNIVIWRMAKEFIIFYRLHDKVSLLTIFEIKGTSIDKSIREIEKISSDVLKILKL